MVAKHKDYVLGLQINASSIGWAAVQLSDKDDKNPVALMHPGVHLFDPGVEGSLLEIKRGKDISRAVAYRQVKQSQRIRERRLERETELFALLQMQGLLPASTNGSPKQRLDTLNNLERELEKALADRHPHNKLPYILRADALDRRLKLFELGRIFYHLVQRRGYQSNRRKPEKEGQEGAVKQGISELAQEMQKLKARTLGEYFSKIDPQKVKIRRRWTSRQMYLDEFEQIWTKQHKYYPDLLTPQLKSQIHRLLFFQRPLASAKHLVGFCEFEPKQRRAPMCSMEAQRFRMRQRINDLRICPIGQAEGSPLTKEEKEALYRLLEVNPQLTYTAVKKHFGFPKSSEFNFQRAGEKQILGNRTYAHHYKVFGDAWLKMTPEQQAETINIWNAAETEKQLVTAGMRHYLLTEEQGKLWASELPESGYCSLSKKAIARLMPHLIEGIGYTTAVEREYGEGVHFKPIHEEIPPVREVFRALANPAVERSLTQTRKIVNALVRRYGKPYRIHIELGNELRRSRKERQNIHIGNKQREASRDKLRERVSEATGIAKQNVSGSDIEKVQLWDECDGFCPYTGHKIPFDALFRGDDWMVTNILPFNRHPDNSFSNKTLIYAPELASVKRNFTPYEAYGKNEDLFDDILRRVDLFKGDLAIEKLHRFEVRSREDLEIYTQRAMNDNRFATKWAMELVGTLYGGRDVLLPQGVTRRAVCGRPSALTALVRRKWALSDLYRELPDDWRAQTLDPIAIACLDDEIFHRMTRYSKDSNAIESPWPDFIDSIRSQVDSIVPSIRVEKKLNGALHQETHYSKPVIDEQGRSWVTVRKPVTAMSKRDIEAIVSKPVREAVLRHFLALEEDLSTCAAANNWPTIQVGKRPAVPIRRARIRKALTVTKVGKEGFERYVANDRNHHMEVFEIDDANGPRYVSRTVSLLEAKTRCNRKQPVIDERLTSLNGVSGRLPKGAKYKHLFVCALMIGDLILLHRDCEHENDVCIPGIYRIRGIAANGQVTVMPLNETRSAVELDKAHEGWSPKVDALRKMGMAPVKVDLLGELHPNGGKIDLFQPRKVATHQ
jgi:CRISPR-associated endonuclease Csn1